MSENSFKTLSGIEISLRQDEEQVETALSEIYEKIDSTRGAIFSSGFDYPGRHSRWDIGFVHPALEFIAKGRSFRLHGLNQQGLALLDLIEPALRQHDHIDELRREAEELTGTVRAPSGFFTERERSKQPSVFSVIRALKDLFQSDNPAGSHFGLYGAFGYDLVLQFENITLTHKRTEDIPDCHLFLPLDITVVDRKREVAFSLHYSVKTPKGDTSALKGGGAECARASGAGSNEISCDHKPGEFAEKVRRVIEGTKRGDYFEVVLSQTFETRFDGLPTRLFRRLAELNPSPYMFLLNFGSEQVIGASPEIYARVTDRRYETCPIAGTIERGRSPLEDAEQARILLSSLKDESELTMCTDVDRNDMARVCVPGTVKVLGRRQLEFYSHLIHTVDHIEGTLAPEFDSLDAFQTHMWACTVTGAPKPAALQEIERLEKSPRGWYSGAVGFLSFDGNINTGITLRTAHLRGGRALIRAGATLLFDSDPEKEEIETRTKAAAFLAALAGLESEQRGAEAHIQVSDDRLLRGIKLLLVDHLDSFVHNLAAYLEALGADVVTLRHGFPEEQLDLIKPDLVLLSPGPAAPEDFGVPDFVGRLAAKKLPVFGVCLGHQGIGQHFGAELGILPTPVHGKTSKIEHYGSEFFAGVEQTFEAGRYHSLYIKEETLPPSIEIMARAVGAELEGGRGVIMAIRHRELPIASVQFHPESLMTLKRHTGRRILANAINLLTQRNGK